MTEKFIPVKRHVFDSMEAGKWYTSGLIIKRVKENGVKSTPNCIRGELHQLVKAGLIEKAHAPKPLRRCGMNGSHYVYRLSGEPYNIKTAGEYDFALPEHLKERARERVKQSHIRRQATKDLPEWFRKMLHIGWREYKQIEARRSNSQNEGGS